MIQAPTLVCPSGAGGTPASVRAVSRRCLRLGGTSEGIQYQTFTMHRATWVGKGVMT